jgi:hypothetical protein
MERNGPSTHALFASEIGSASWQSLVAQDQTPRERAGEEEVLGTADAGKLDYWSGQMRQTTP